jgi:hypothetical protein
MIFILSACGSYPVEVVDGAYLIESNNFLLRVSFKVS